MAVIPRGYIDALTKSLNTLSTATQEAVKMQLSMIEYVDIADLRNQVIEILEPILSTATDLAAAYSAQTYDSIREYSIGEANGATAYSGRVPEATEGAVRSFVGDAERLGYDWFVLSVLERCDYEIKRAAGESTLYNAERDPKKPRFARVPTGAETCTFCLMLASRGFVYHSEASAGAFDHWHSHCDCRIIQGYPGDEIEGYDPEAIYGKWKRLETEKNERAIKRGLNKVWQEFKKDKTEGNYDKTVRAYLKTINPQIDAEYRAKPLPKEIQAADWLATQSKKKVEFNRESSVPGSNNPDIQWDGRNWEIKRIESSNSGKVYERAKEAAIQSRNVVIDLSLRTISIDDAVNKLREAIDNGVVDEAFIVTDETLEKVKR